MSSGDTKDIFERALEASEKALGRATPDLEHRSWQYFRVARVAQGEKHFSTIDLGEHFELSL